jgi:hypothetical protein
LEPEAKVQEYVAANHFSWQFALDTAGQTLRDYRVGGLPTSFFIGRDGVIRDIVVGATTRAVMEGKIARLLN